MGSTITFYLIQRALGYRKKVSLSYLSLQHIVLHPVQRQEAFSIVSFPLVHLKREIAHFCQHHYLTLSQWEDWGWGRRSEGECSLFIHEGFYI